MTEALPSPSDIKIIFCDVDGTLLGSDHKLHPRTISTVTRFREKYPEIPIVVASGKQFNSCEVIRETLGLPVHYPAIHCNGALIYGGETGSLVRSHGLDADTVEYIVDNTKRFGTFIFDEREVLLVNQGEGVNKKDWYAIASKYDRDVSDLSEEEARANALLSVRQGKLVIAKVTICADESDLIDTAAELANLEQISPYPFRMTRAIPFIFEAIPHAIGKATAAVEVCNLLGIDPQNAMAFGDGDNDIDLFRVVGHPVAMANGMPSAKAAAKYITTSHDEGGVGEFIEQIWNLD